MRVNYAIIFVSDMKQAVAFYRDVMGLPLKFETPGSGRAGEQWSR